MQVVVGVTCAFRARSDSVIGQTQVVVDVTCTVAARSEAVVVLGGVSSS